MCVNNRALSTISRNRKNDLICSAATDAWSSHRVIPGQRNAPRSLDERAPPMAWLIVLSRYDGVFFSSRIPDDHRSTRIEHAMARRLPLLGGVLRFGTFGASV